MLSPSEVFKPYYEPTLRLRNNDKKLKNILTCNWGHPFGWIVAEETPKAHCSMGQSDILDNLIAAIHSIRSTHLIKNNEKFDQHEEVDLIINSLLVLESQLEEFESIEIVKRLKEVLSGLINSDSTHLNISLSVSRPRNNSVLLSFSLFSRIKF